MPRALAKKPALSLRRRNQNLTATKKQTRPDSLSRPRFVIAFDPSSAPDNRLIQLSKTASGAVSDF
jgi:hypothetical protein